MSRALVLSNDGLAVREVAMAPEPRRGWVRVRLRLAGICRTDLAVARGELPVQRPRVLGHEATGVVCAVGAGAPTQLVGQTVGIDPRFGGFLGVHIDGAFASEVDLPAERAVALDPAVSDARAAYLEPVAAALGAIPHLAAAQRSLVLGANRIAELTLLLARAEGLDPAHAASIEDVEPRAHDLVVESDPALIPDAIGALGDGGTLVLKSRPVAATPMPHNEIVMRSLTLRGAPYGDFAHAARLLADTSLPFESLFGESFALEDFERAFTLARGSESRKTFLRLGDD